jgi:hypothetical protein
MKEKMMMVKYDKKNERKVMNVTREEDKAGNLLNNILFTNLVHTLDHGTYLLM